MLYRCGLRLSELLNLKIMDIQSDRHLLLVRDAKGGKDRTTVPGDTTLQLLRKYYLMYRPKEYLFEGQSGGMYSSKSVRHILQHSLAQANYEASITPYTAPFFCHTSAGKRHRSEAHTVFAGAQFF